MSIRLGNYHLATYTRDQLSSASPSAEANLEMLEGLEKLCSFFVGTSFEWFLVGGFGTDLGLGRLTRMHGDFDVEVKQESIPDLIEHMGQRGFQFFRKIFSSNIPSNKRIVLYEKSDGSDYSLERGHKFRLLPCDNGRIIDGKKTLLSYIDISAYRISNGCVEVGYKGKIVTSNQPYTTDGRVAVIGDWKIKLRHPTYHDALMRINPCKKNNLNQEAIRKLLSIEGNN